jgi:phosphatidylglycerol:prolipoprotein diacylglycerol transferase
MLENIITLFRSLFAPPRHLILMLAALWLGLSLAEKRAQRHALSKDVLNNIVYYGILGYVVGGRLLFVLANLSAFIESPLSVFSINPDLFDPTGALVTGILVGFIYGRRQGLPLWSSLDALTPLFATLAIGLSLSHLAAGTAYGSPTNLPWGIDLWNATRHPSQIYELIGSAAIFGWIWFRKTDPLPGSEVLPFIALTAGSRLFLEAFRGDSLLILRGVRLEQVIAWLVLASALIAGEWLRTAKETN